MPNIIIAIQNIPEALSKDNRQEKEIKDANWNGTNQMIPVADDIILYIGKPKDSIKRLKGFMVELKIQNQHTKINSLCIHKYFHGYKRI